MAEEKIKKVRTSKVKPEEIIKYVNMPVQIYRKHNDMLDYKNAVTYAENFLTPQRYSLLQIYINISIDAHLTAAIQQRKNLTLCKKFNVFTNGEINEEKSKLIKKKWFREYMDLAMDSIFWGHSLIQFDALDVIKQEFERCELVPRQFVKPEFHIVVKSWGDSTGQSYLEDGFENWTLGIGKDKDLGLLLKAAPLIIWKQQALGAWAEYQDKFGTPFRYAKTNIRDEESRKNANSMMENWGVSPWAVFDKEDIVEFLETTKQDAHLVFDQMILRVNSEISKLMLGQTATMDEKSFVGSAEVQERILQSYAESDEYLVSGWNNYQLVPLLISHSLLAEGDTIEPEESEALSIIEKSKIDIELIKTGKYMLSPEYLKEKYGTEVEVVDNNKDNNSIENVVNRLDNLYS